MPRPGTTTQRGYGYQHQAARRAAIRNLRDGTPCARCGYPMYRADAANLHLDHDDQDRRRYRGLAHATCNTRAGQAKRQPNRSRREPHPEQPQRQSRRW